MLETISTKRARRYQRKFDHDEMLRLWETGDWMKADLARLFGVSESRIAQIVDPEVRDRVQRNAAERCEAICDDCGGRAVHNWSAKNARHDRIVCLRCSRIRQREEHLLARLDENGDVRCSKCGEHHPIGDYRMDRGFPESQCRHCQAATRRDYRRRHIEAARAYDRERYRLYGRTRSP